MTIKTSLTTDPENLTMTFSAELDVPVERAWQLWADPRQFERWWGPPDFPITVDAHDLVTGGRVSFFMKGPDGERVHDSQWEVLAADPPKRLELKDAITDAAGVPTDEGPSILVVTFAERAGRGTLMATEWHFPSVAALAQAADMGMEEWFQAQTAQFEAVLADD